MLRVPTDMDADGFDQDLVDNRMYHVSLLVSRHLT